MELKAARVISYILHPLFMPLYGLLIIFNLKIHSAYSLGFTVQFFMLLMVFFSCVAFPLLLLTFLRRAGYISSFFLEKRAERTYPILGTLLAYYITYFLFSRTTVPAIYGAFFFNAALLSLALLLINMKWKVSLHTAGMGALCGLVAVISFRLSLGLTLFFCLMILLSGLTAYARIVIKAHRPSEVYTGFLTGFLVTACCFMLL